MALGDIACSAPAPAEEAKRQLPMTMLLRQVAFERLAYQRRNGNALTSGQRMKLMLHGLINE